MTGPNFFGVLSRPQDAVLGEIGLALGQVKHARGLTAEDMRKVFGLKVDDMVSKYIAGEAEMGLMAWLRALEAWPELADRLEESALERSLRARQRPLDLDLPQRRAGRRDWEARNGAGQEVR